MLQLRQCLGALVATATLAAGVPAAQSADLYGGRGSIKDDVPYVRSSAAGPCYVRADVGYSLSTTPDVHWPVTDAVTGDLIGSKVSHVEIDNTWLVEGGFGCTSGVWRGELVFGYRGEHRVDGVPILWNPAPGVTDPLHTSLRSTTLMLNVYRDLGHWGAFTPYVGAGGGLAYNRMHAVRFTENPALVHRIEGDSDFSFAWQLMAGVGYRLSSNTTLDLGYRYVDLGKATSGRMDDAGFVNPRVVIDDIAAHEFKIGIRYSFGGGDLMPLK